MIQGSKERIISDLKCIIKDLTGQDIIPSLEHPKDQRHGDYSTNIALTLFANSKINPSADGQKSKVGTALELAQKITEIFNSQLPTLNFLEKIEAVAPGFINFWLSKEYLISQLGEIAKKGDKYGFGSQDLEKKAVVEYSSPNIAKPFTIGHLRSTIIGDAIANLLQANGWKVYRDNHLGDWGTQFGKLIYAIKEMGKDEKGKVVDYEYGIEKSKNPIKELVSLYVIFHNEAEKNPHLEDVGRKWFRKLEDGDKEARRLWKKCVEWSLKEFKKIYDALGVEFTENNGEGFGESFFEDKMGEVIKELDEKGLLKESEGAKLVFFPKDPTTLRQAQGSGQGKSFGSAQDKYPPLMIIKKDGATLYATRDLATDKFRLNKYGKDVVIINEVGIEQSLYFKQIFEVEKMLGWVKDGQRIHIKHGHYRFKDEKMSTRKGNVIWLEEVLEEAIRRAYRLSSDATFNVNYENSDLVKQKLETNKRNRFDHLMNEEEAIKTAKDVAVGAIKWNDLKRSSNLDIIFDWDEILNMEGNSGPYLQYTYARTQSVLAKIKNESPIQSGTKIKNKNVILGRSSALQNDDSRISLAWFTVQGDSGQARMTDYEMVPKNYKLQPEELALLRTLYCFPEIVEEAAEKFAPNLLCNYLFDLAQKFNLFYQKIPILKDQKGSKSAGVNVKHPKGVIEVQVFRLALTMAVGQVIKNGLYLLGIKVPTKM